MRSVTKSRRRIPRPASPVTVTGAWQPRDPGNLSDKAADALSRAN